MSKKPVMVAVLAAITSQSTFADSDEIKALEQCVKYLEQCIQDQDATIRENNENTNEVHNTFSVGGVIELELGYDEIDDERAESVLDLGKVELIFGVSPTNQLAADIVLSYDGDADIELDEAIVTYTTASGNAFSAGQFDVPFGVYETGLVSDPITIDLGETSNTTAMGEFGLGPIGAAIYAFSGEVSDGGTSSVNNFGFNLGYETEARMGSLALNLGYINNIAESDGMQDVLGTRGEVVNYVPGIALSGMAEMGALRLIAEYVAATDEFAADEFAFEGAGATPSAWALELDYDIAMGGKDATLAFSVQGSDEADGLLPESKTLAGISFDLVDNVSLGLEYSVAEDYSGSEEKAFLALLAYEF